MGEDILNVLMNEYNRSDLEEKNIQASKTLDFINERISFIGNELNDVENTLFNFRKKNNILKESTYLSILKILKLGSKPKLEPISY